MSKYVYPAIFTPAEEGGYLARFPDLDGCYTDGKDLIEVMEMAQDALCLCLYNMEQDNKPIPEVSNISAVQVDGKNSFISLVCCDTIEYREFFGGKAVKKTVSIPSWLNDRAMQAGINFSQTLQDALKRKLSIR